MERETEVRERGSADANPAPPPRGAQGVPARPSPSVARHDRWAWRRAIRADPRKYRIYRAVVGVVGVLLILLGVTTGWLPGPGGIPLVLLGLAVLASEFPWAHRLLQRARVKAHEFTEWTTRLPWWVRGLGTVATAAVLVAIGWLSLTVLGVPDWVPGQVTTVIDGIPGVE